MCNGILKLVLNNTSGLDLGEVDYSKLCFGDQAVKFNSLNQSG